MPDLAFNSQSAASPSSASAARLSFPTRRAGLASSMVVLSLILNQGAMGQTTTTPTDSDAAETSDSYLAGHSKHGEEFNQGPRQQAYLMPGTGDISFDVTSEDKRVQPFIQQGIGQLHGFWYFEAERSFRQAAMFDPQCAIAYWGMAMANTNNKDRAKKLIQQAVERSEHASEREQRYITSLDAFLNGDEKRKKREANFVSAMEAIVKDFPEDLEAKAFLGYALYKYRSSADKTHAEVDVILDQVLAKSKNHPVHHYRIHLWDHKSPQRALDSAAQCGPSAKTIAHMWHMCGHIFSRVKRYDDASWFQEASARVDHRHMMHDRVLPDQIHNFAHNNEWLIRNLMHVGRIQDALDLAKNMTELPRHPKYNTLDKRNSATYGRDRLMDVLDRFELWDVAISLANTPYLEPTDDPEEQRKRWKLLGEAYARTHHLAEAHSIVEALEDQLDVTRSKAPSEEEIRKSIAAAEKDEDESADTEPADEEADEPADEEAVDELAKRESALEKKVAKELKKKQKSHEREVAKIEKDIAHVSAYIALAREQWQEGLQLLEKADADKLSQAQVRVLVDDDVQAVKDAKEYAKKRLRQVQPLAGLVEVCWAAGKREAAIEAFVRLRAISNRMELQSPVFQRIVPIAEELGYGSDFRVARPAPTDLGDQPSLDSLGPFRWQPAPGPDWLLPDATGKLHSLREYRGRPVLAVFYLGYGCLHCAEQLQALAPQTAEFRKAGIDIIAISSDDVGELERSHENYEEEFPFPLVADPTLTTFKNYRAFDDFEDVPLHGTYLIDARGRIRWQDISYDPFMDIDFLLKESQRLLSQESAPPAETPSQLALLNDSPE